MEKKEIFEYFVYKLYNNNKNNDLSKLKVLKLLFLTCSASTSINDDKGLFQYFDNFAAMPFGHVEIDIYNLINNNQLDFFEINEKQTVSKKQASKTFSKVNDSVKMMVDDSIKLLIENNSNIFEYDAFRLVEMSHLFSSWKFYYQLARENDQYKKNIPVESLINERKYYSFV